ncbi:baseplate J/gp47 family protein [Pantoea stewartii]|uniref:baseplate J/gp47 family protein n=1 Tax=Pantoea stewartii TaxID=66269 RepID=UPI0025A039DE|nr:baseplate J/gp47 family protein [Pantoea stewartii]
MADDVIVTTSVPAATLSDIGLSVPDEKDILDGRLSDLDDAMGGGMSKSLTSPQGQIAMSETAIIADKNDQLLAIVNGINPDYASGRFQDAIGRIYFIDRIAEQGTTVTAVATGLVGTIIPAGSTAQDDAGYIYSSLSSAVIPASGSVSILFQNQTPGPIACPSGSLNTIYRAISGWSGINNPSGGVLGNIVESRSNFEARRRDSVARNSRNMDGSVLSAVLNVNGVQDAYVWSNRLASTVNRGTTNFPVVGHSVYICVYGGADADVAEAIFQTCNPGANMNGDTTFTVYDTQNYSAPYPEYVMQWQRAITTPVYFRVTLDKTLNPPSDITVQVRKMITQVFTGGYDGIAKARIGATINASKYYAPVISISPDTVGILSLEVSLDGSTYGPSVTMGIDRIPTIQDSNITVVLS